MSLRVKRDGTALWRGKAVGAIREEDLEWCFYPYPAAPAIIPSVVVNALSNMELRNRLTRMIVRNERVLLNKWDKK